MKKLVIPLVIVALMFGVVMSGDKYKSYDLTENFTWDDSSETQTLTIPIRGAYQGEDGEQLYKQLIRDLLRDGRHY
ncbi:MAG: hypothetical protein ACYTEQ_30025 [Planctomycetota bacterium]|jgi:hypothetical protein